MLQKCPFPGMWHWDSQTAQFLRFVKMYVNYVQIILMLFVFLAAAADPLDAPLDLSFKTLVSTVSSMMFSEGEAHRLIEILSEKGGIVQDTWHMV